MANIISLEIITICFGVPSTREPYASQGININIGHLRLNYGRSQSVSGASLIAGQHEYCAQMVPCEWVEAEGGEQGRVLRVQFSSAWTIFNNSKSPSLIFSSIINKCE